MILTSRIVSRRLPVRAVTAMRSNVQNHHRARTIITKVPGLTVHRPVRKNHHTRQKTETNIVTTVQAVAAVAVAHQKNCPRINQAQRINRRHRTVVHIHHQSLVAAAIAASPNTGIVLKIKTYRKQTTAVARVVVARVAVARAAVARVAADQTITDPKTIVDRIAKRMSLENHRRHHRHDRAQSDMRKTELTRNRIKIPAPMIHSSI